MPKRIASARPGSEGLANLRAELHRLARAKDHAAAAYIAYFHAQRGLTGEELQRAMTRTAQAQEAFERINELVHEKENEIAAREQSLFSNTEA